VQQLLYDPERSLIEQSRRHAPNMEIPRIFWNWPPRSGGRGSTRDQRIMRVPTWAFVVDGSSRPKVAVGDIQLGHNVFG
jgi:hypothetical protein